MPNTLPIPIEILQKDYEIPKKIVAIGKVDKDAALEYLERWAVKKDPTTVLYREVTNFLEGMQKNG